MARTTAQREIIAARISSRCFKYDRELNAFVAEVAALDDGLDAVPAPFRRLYAGEAACGFVMVSHVTGAEAPFRLVETRFNARGCAVAYRFASDAPAITAAVYLSTYELDDDAPSIDVAPRRAPRCVARATQLPVAVG